ncbi:Qat anti-phage system TatD family nuclease QatD [Segetibacter koreensis]|uniref:Qat anti-phage system TatD family nuclease QatD n=1 Tax=Segetibacter koreensis TaxID=398037 RepID=UPI0003707C84|nr:Qat anti-phage system TatD family nuclease QatD [Segetibacter koreensis]
MNYYIDAHCHVDLLKNIQYSWTNEDSLPIKTISVTNAPFIYEPSKRLFSNSKNIRVALGMHPELVDQYGSQLNLFEKLIGDTKYIGEIGLDGSPRFSKSFEYQKKVFIEILSLCKSSDKKVLTIHTRNAASETIELLEKYLAKSSCRVIFHWYSGNQTDLKAAIRNGYYFSVNHKMVASEKGKQIIMSIPNHLLLTETDAPFTFSDNIKSRLDSLRAATEGLGLMMKQDLEAAKSCIYNNFKTMLKDVN